MKKLNLSAEAELVNEFRKLISDVPGKNFAKPLSEFWEGCQPHECAVYGCTGVWFSAEGGTTMKDNTIPADAYSDFLHPEFKEFLKNHKNVYLDWYDGGTPMLIMK